MSQGSPEALRQRRQEGPSPRAQEGGWPCPAWISVALPHLDLRLLALELRQDKCAFMSPVQWCFVKAALRH